MSAVPSCVCELLGGVSDLNVGSRSLMPRDLPLGGQNWGLRVRAGSIPLPAAPRQRSKGLVPLSQAWTGCCCPGRWRGMWGPWHRREVGCRVLVGWIAKISVLLHRDIQS